MINNLHARIIYFFFSVVFERVLLCNTPAKLDQIPFKFEKQTLSVFP